MLIRVSKRYFRLMLNSKAHNRKVTSKDADFIVDFLWLMGAAVL